MKRLLLLLLFTTSFLSAKYLYMGHFWRCTWSSQQTSFTIENNINQNTNIKSVFHCFNNDAITWWIEGENNAFHIMNYYTDHFGNLSLFCNCIFEDKDTWRNFEDCWIKTFNPARVSRKIIDLN